MNKIKSIDFRYFISTFLAFTVILISINNYIHPEYSSLSINTFKKQFNTKNIEYFKKQKWSKKKWFAINSIIDDQKKINIICDIKNSLNLTDDSFYYVILNNKKQLIPFVFERHGDKMRILLNQIFIKITRKKY